MLNIFKERLKAKSTASGVNLSKERIAAFADRLHKKFPDLTEESEHDKPIEDLDELISFSDIAREDDRLRTLEKKVNETKQPEPPKPTDPKTVDPSNEEPAWFKAYREATDAKLNAIEKEKTVGTIKQQLAEKLKDVPASIWSKRMLPETPEGIDAFVSEVQADYKTDFIDKGLAQIPRPGGGSGGGTKKMTKEEVQALNDSLLPKN